MSLEIRVTSLVICDVAHWMANTVNKRNAGELLENWQMDLLVSLQQ